MVDSMLGSTWFRSYVFSVLSIGLVVACGDRGLGGEKDSGGTSEGEAGDERGEDGDERGDEGKEEWGEDDDRPESECGNGEKEILEQCDGEDLGGLSCQDLGWFDGTLACASCKFDESACSPPPDDAIPECGNGMKEPGEACDGEDLGGLTCEDFGLIPGESELACAEGCKIDLRGCRGGDGKGENCGNGQLDPGETCDGSTAGLTCADLGFNGGELSCDPSYCFLITEECN